MSLDSSPQLMPLLLKLANKKRMSSSYIFTGTQASELKKQATLLAKRLNCYNEIICEECISCRKIERGTHPDIHLINSEGETIKIDRIRELQKRIRLKTFEGTYKVIIIQGAENLHAASSNAILKTLEEPPDKTLFLLLTPYSERLLETITSRCHTIRFPSQKIDLPQIEFVQDLLTLPKTQDGLFELAAKIARDDETFHHVLEFWLGWYRTLLLTRQGLPLPDKTFEENEVLAENRAKHYSIEHLHGQLQAILETKRNLQYQVKRDLLAENLLIKLTS